MDVKQELARQAGRNGTAGNGKAVQKKEVTLTRSMSIEDLIHAMEPEIRKALPSVVTPERFTRMALSALNNSPKLRECTQMSFLAALMNAAQLGLEPKLDHVPAFEDRGELVAVYALFRLQNGGFGFEVMSRGDVDAYARRYSQAVDSSYSPWKSNYEEMAKKTVIKRVLKYAPLKTEFARAMSVDNAIQNEIGIDMSEIQSQQEFIEGDYQETET